MSKILDQKSLDIRISVVIPCFQSEATLSEVVFGIVESIGNMDRLKYEILLVLDGPTDRTPEIAAKLENEIDECRVIELSRNFGQHPAIFAGIESSNYEIIITMDDDGQHLPSELPTLIKALSSEIDLVYGLPNQEEHGLMRSFASRFFKTLLFRILGIKNARDISAFRIFRKSLLRDIELKKISSGTVDVVLHWSTTRIRTVNTNMKHRSEGKSNYTLKSLMKFAMQMIVGYSVRPLKFALFIGLVGFLFSAALAIYFFVQYIQGEVKVAGFSTITILITTLSSIQLVTLGILGEYIANIHQKSIGKPMYYIRKSSNI
jgi:undecaprenyl-phosphate 4-deoxy-4-formamido-L-arabinose transferase